MHGKHIIFLMFCDNKLREIPARNCCLKNRSNRLLTRHLIVIRIERVAMQIDYICSTTSTSTSTSTRFVLFIVSRKYIRTHTQTHANAPEWTRWSRISFESAISTLRNVENIIVERCALCNVQHVYLSFTPAAMHNILKPQYEHKFQFHWKLQVQPMYKSYHMIFIRTSQRV